MFPKIHRLKILVLPFQLFLEEDDFPFESLYFTLCKGVRFLLLILINARKSLLRNILEIINYSVN